MAFISNNLSSGWDRHAPRETTSFDRRLRASMDGVQLDPNDPENLTAAQLRAANELAQREDRTHQAVSACVQTGEAWLTEHPEFVKNQVNYDLMNHELLVRFGDIEWTLAHYDAAYQSLRSSNFLKLNPAVLAKQTNSDAQTRAAAERARTAIPSEEQMEGMSKAELRMRATELGAIRAWGK
jgi:hypothetical protein